MSLEAEIKKRRQQIATDALSMSVGELIALYRDEELDIHPDFQRFFRWTDFQKSRFIESLLLGIPIPSIFVSQTGEGVWEVIDGLQRLSTILEAAGELRDSTGKRLPPLTLSATKYLPSLEGRSWEGANGLPEAVKLAIKRSRIDVKIVLATSDQAAKYELFNRLNTGGSLATDQEVRNCVLIMVDKTFFDWMSALAKDTNFRECIPLSDRSIDEQFDLELIVRFLVLRKASIESLREIRDLGTFLSDKIVELAGDAKLQRDQEAKVFKDTFAILAQSLGDDAFRRYDINKKRALGPVLVSVFEVMALGVGYNIGTKKPTVERVVAVHRDLWNKSEFTSGTGSGVRAADRIGVTVPLGRKLFAK